MGILSHGAKRRRVLSQNKSLQPTVIPLRGLQAAELKQLSKRAIIHDGGARGNACKSSRGSQLARGSGGLTPSLLPVLQRAG